MLIMLLVLGYSLGFYKGYITNECIETVKDFCVCWNQTK